MPAEASAAASASAPRGSHFGLGGTGVLPGVAMDVSTAAAPATAGGSSPSRKRSAEDDGEDPRTQAVGVEELVARRLTRQ